MTTSAPRRGEAPRLPGPTDLAVEEVVDDVRDALRAPGVAVLRAETGAGKTTILPLRLLAEPWIRNSDGRAGRLIVIEPRRIAARMAAERMASLCGERLGETIGLTTRDERVRGPNCRVEVVTDGVMIRRLQRDPELQGISGLVFDEFHERGINADLALALALDVRGSLRDDLRLLVMSATIDVEAVAKMLSAPVAAPVISSRGRSFPVSIHWAPPEVSAPRSSPPTHRHGPPVSAQNVAHVAAVVRRAVDETAGDVLVFLPGIGEIRRTQQVLGSSSLPGDVDVRCLHGSFSSADQRAAVEPCAPGRRKVVLATDVAETSITVDGVTAVVDLGLARIAQVDPASGLTRLVTRPTSQASAEQRAGRAGRTQPGRAYRLYAESEFARRPRFTLPEMVRVDLCPLVLELAAWGVTDPAQLAWLDRPNGAMWDQAQSALRLLGALGEDGRITEDGRRMVEFGAHPRLARMILAGGAPACDLAAMIEDGRAIRPEFGRDRAAIDIAAIDHRDRDRAVARRADRFRQTLKSSAFGAGIAGGSADIGRWLLSAYPDRLAQRRGERGKYRLVNGRGAVLDPADPLASSEYLVAVDGEGERTDGRIHAAVGVDAADIEAVLGRAIEVCTSVEWSEDTRRLLDRTRRGLGAVDFAVTDRPAKPSANTVEALVTRIETEGPGLFRWSAGGRDLRSRLAFLRSGLGDPWPAVDDASLTVALAEWVRNYGFNAVSLSDIEKADVVSILRALVPYSHIRQLDDLVPTSIQLSNGVLLKIDWGGDAPTISARAQQFFGVTVHPSVGGGSIPLRVVLLSPAGRPLQTTSDLPGFWAGSWADVRKDMAGRYPKHSWPVDPSIESPPSPRRPR